MTTPRDKIRDYLKAALHNRGDNKPFSDSDPLVSSNRLDSLAVIEMIAFLEEQFSVDFSRLDFDQSLVDSVDAITALTA